MLEVRRRLVCWKCEGGSCAGIAKADCVLECGADCVLEVRRRIVCWITVCPMRSVYIVLKSTGGLEARRYAGKYRRVRRGELCGVLKQLINGAGEMSCVLMQLMRQAKCKGVLRRIMISCSLYT